MKRRLWIITALVGLLTILCCVNASAAITTGQCGDNVFWELNFSANELTISGSGPMWDDYINLHTEDFDNYMQREALKSIVICNGITRIGENAFADKLPQLRSVSIPDTVVSIGEGAFYNCPNLMSIDIPYGVRTIETSTFMWCEKLTSITLPNGLTSIDENAFFGCEKLTDIILPDSLTSIGSDAFRGCTSLTSIAIPDGVTNIGNSAFTGCTSLSGTITIPYGITSLSGTFANCKNLTGIIIPDSVTRIDGWAFSNCDSITSITIPASVNEISNASFTTCDNLVDIIVDENNPSYASSNGFLYNKARTILLQCPGGKISANHYNLGSVIRIEEKAFYQCSRLSDVNLPDSVTEIGDYAFYECSGLISLSTGNGVKIIGESAFSDCSNLASVTFGKNLEVIMEYAFYRDSSLTEITIPARVKKISSYSFYYSKISSATILSLDMKFSNYSFNNPDLIIYGREGSSAQQFAGNNRYDFYLLSSPVIDNGTYGNNLMWELSDERILTISGTGEMPDFEDLQDDSAWRRYLPYIDEVRIESGVTSIGDCAFADCTSLFDAILPNNMTRIGNSAFRGCGFLTDILLPDQLTIIGDNVFYNCNKLMNIVLPDSLLKIGEYAFYRCSSLNGITIPNSTTEVGEFAFANCSSLAYVDFSNSLICIEQGTFEYCTSLSEVVIPNKVISIGSSAFYYCTSLASVTICNKEAVIANWAFSNCSSEIIFFGWDNSTAETFAISWPYRPFVVLWSDKTYPESAHPYSDNLDETWTYVCPFEAEYIMIHFLNTTETEAGIDWIYITDNTGNTETYTGMGLNGKNVLIPGNSFKIRLTSDDSETRFGFTIDSIMAVTAEEYEDLSLPQFTINDGVITEYSPNIRISELIIPETVDGQTVTAIGDRVFANHSEIISVTIPDSVISIGEYAFSNCTGLTHITIPESIISIGGYSFSNCNSLTHIEVDPDNQSFSSVDGVLFNKSQTIIICYPQGKADSTYIIPDSVILINEAAFSDCEKLTSISIPYGVTSIGDLAFRGCYNISSITIPGTAVNIGEYAFAGCSNLGSIVINNGVMDIGEGAFSNCVSLCTVTIPASVFSIKDNPFLCCPALTEIIVDSNNREYTSEEGILFNKAQTVLIAYPAGKEDFSYTISGNINQIGAYAFTACNRLIEIAIPENVTRIGLGAFDNCDNLTAIVSPNSYALDYCLANNILYSYFKLDNGYPESDHPYDNDMDETWTYIYPFEADYTRIHFVDGTEFEAEYDWIYITDSTGNTTSFTGGALSGKEIILPGNSFEIRVTSDVSVTRYGFAIDCITGMTAEEYEKFVSPFTVNNGVITEYNPSTPVSKLVIPESIGGEPITGIGYGAFQYHQELTSVILPDTIINIENDAFLGCTGLTEIIIPENMTTIGSWAFCNCNNLTSITIPQNVTSIGTWAFVACDNLTDIHVDSDNETYFSVDGVLFDKTQKTIIRYPAGKEETEYSIPNTVHYIDDGAFASCYRLSSITIPNSVISIGNEAFEYCFGLASIIIPEGVTNIGFGAFYNCANLTEIVIPNSMISIGEVAFGECGITNITIPAGVTTMTGNPFRMCPMLMNITVDSNNHEYLSENGVLFNKAQTVLIAYPAAKNDSYYSVPESVVQIGESAFSACSNLNDIVIPNSVTSIDLAAFQQCTGLTEMKIPRSVTSINDYAFDKCINLNSIIIYNAGVAFGKDVFYGCSTLTINGWNGSTTETYANDIGISFVNLVDDEPTFFLPENLTIIESGAFSGIAAKGVVIPKTVTVISGDPFDGSNVITIYGYASSAAEYYAASAGYNFVPINDDWMESH